ncbi:hypothetical protein BDN71DRAFT_575676 [Pleurotus eryngii]|uniref:Uncharacterized protein n=1 Tax=Pleurotus eryngii TaxID=5323 RepID=A0A9P6D9M2_PLEER|nr:hypothetical protein BDN71DRAFT_575676 [Pleurotus eryngii]
MTRPSQIRHSLDDTLYHLGLLRSPHAISPTSPAPTRRRHFNATPLKYSSTQVLTSTSTPVARTFHPPGMERTG